MTNKQSWGEIEKHYDDFLHYYYNCPCKGCPEGHASMWKSIVESPQWKEWEKVKILIKENKSCINFSEIEYENIQDFGDDLMKVYGCYENKHFLKCRVNE